MDLSKFIAKLKTQNLKFQKIFYDLQTTRRTFFRMKLRGKNIIFGDRTSEIFSIIARGGDDILVVGDNIITMHKIITRRVFNVIK